MNFSSIVGGKKMRGFSPIRHLTLVHIIGEEKPKAKSFYHKGCVFTSANDLHCKVFEQKEGSNIEMLLFLYGVIWYGN